MWGWFKNFFPSYTDGSVDVSGKVAAEALKHEGYEVITPHDRVYSKFERERLIDLIELYHTDLGPYNHPDEPGGADEVPNCNHFSVHTWADVIRGCKQEGIKYMPLFGIIKYVSVRDIMHMNNFAIFNDDDFQIFDSQRRVILSPETEVKRPVRINF